MLSKLTLKDFQNHKDTTLEFSPGVNVIVGSSDAGKSALIRALEWVRTNRPRGDGFIRHGKKACSVQVECVSDKTHTIIRSRSGRNNEYQLDNNMMKAVGSDVPMVITDCLKLDDLNVQHQLSPHFLVLDSPGAIAKSISAAIHLEAMDACVSEANRRVRSLNGKVTAEEESIESLAKELETFKDLAQLAADLEQAEELHSNINELTDKRNSLFQSIAALTETEDLLASLPDKDDVMAVLEQIGALEDVVAEEAALSMVVDQCIVLEKAVAAIPDEHAVNTALEQISALEDSTERFAGLELIVGGMNSNIIKIGDHRKNAKVLRRKLAIMLKDEACPMCGQSLDADACKHVMEN